MSEKNFKNLVIFDERKKESQKKLLAYPLYIPLIIEKHKKCQLPALDRFKYLISGDLKLLELQQQIRKKLKLESNQSLFFFINKTKLDKGDSLLKDIYQKQKDSDGFLYIEYTNLETFG